jgi:hypothetical protein
MLAPLDSLLANHYPELTKLAELLGDQAKTFLDQYEGQVLKVPSRSELREMASPLACHATLKDLNSTHAVKAGKKLQVEPPHGTRGLRPLANHPQHTTHPLFKDRIKQLEFAEARLDHGTKRLEWLDSILAQRPFVAGERDTIADITAQVAINISAAMGRLYASCRRAAPEALARDDVRMHRGGRRAAV